MAGIYYCCASPWTCRFYLSLFIEIIRRSFIFSRGVRFLAPAVCQPFARKLPLGRESISAMRLGPPVHSASSWFINQTTIHSFIPPRPTPPHTLWINTQTTSTLSPKPFTLNSRIPTRRSCPKTPIRLPYHPPRYLLRVPTLSSMKLCDTVCLATILHLW